MYIKTRFFTQKISININYSKYFAMTKRNKRCFMVVPSIFSLSSLSILMKYENVRSSDAQDEGEKIS